MTIILLVGLYCKLGIPGLDHCMPMRIEEQSVLSARAAQAACREAINEIVKLTPKGYRYVMLTCYVHHYEE